ncbi:DUF5681 domain-containing protein [Marimonas lutisalis]|uniref:DUF5681 domain-containing protein n=1 Tax=Marimonas lutisalis TaxID=2545756 RepID=UPI0010F45D8F|nr:DUF5681 domain-containing protein [Marimonas lutisalis]
MSEQEKDYEVGYGKPPKDSRFKKGQSGNPKGRPKLTKNVDTMLRDTLFRPVVITDKGKRRTVTALEAFFQRLLKNALDGDARSAEKLLKLLPVLQAGLEREEAAAQAEAAVAARDDRPVLEALQKLMGGALGDVFLDGKQGDGDA